MIIFIFQIFMIIIECNTENEHINKAHTTLNVYEEEPKVNDVATSLLNLFLNDDGTERVKDLKEKLKKIDSYVIDRDKYSEILLNESMSTNLTETNFYKALNESDHFAFIPTDNVPKNLYLRLKEKMNRDDIMKILTEQSKNSTLARSARKMMNNGLLNKANKHSSIDIIVDKIIAEVPKDKHRFEYHQGDDRYWDPKNELENLKDYHKHDGRRIYKGERSTITRFPFMASVHVMGRFWCGGSIYSSDIVLTSASCLQLLHNNRFFRENPRVISVRVGSNHSRIGGEMVDILEVYFHPGYNSRTLRHNIAILRLRRHLNFDHHRLPKLIAISHEEGGISPTSEVLVLGWGVTKMTQQMKYEPIFLNRKILPVFPNVFCKEVYGKNFITQTMFCAGTVTTGEGACDHDAGGPAVIAGKLVGIISFGPAICGYPNAPTVFTLVGAYSDWIETICENMPGHYQGKVRTTKKFTFSYVGLEYLKTMHGKPVTKISDYSDIHKSANDTTNPKKPPLPGPTTPSFRVRGEIPPRGASKPASPGDDSTGWSFEMY